MRGGTTTSATGRRFSRSPLTSDVSTGVSSTTRSVAVLPTESVTLMVSVTLGVVPAW